MRLGPAAAGLAWLMVAAPAPAQDLPPGTLEPLVRRLEALVGAVPAAGTPLPEGVRFLVRFTDDVSGLGVGSPVTVRGLRVGTVREVAVVIDTSAATIDVPVVIDVVPDRLTVDGDRPADEAAVYALAERLVENGLRAALEAATPFGEPQHVALAFAPDAPPAHLDRTGRYPAIPAAPSLADELRSTVDDLLARIVALPLEETVAEANATLVALRALVTAPEIREALDLVAVAGDELRAFVTGPELREIMATLLDAARELQRTAAGLDARLDPSLEALARAAVTVESAARETTAVASGLERSIGPRSPLWDELMQASREVTGTTRALRLLVEYLERHPDALLRGRPETRP